LLSQKWTFGRINHPSNAASATKLKCVTRSRCGTAVPVRDGGPSAAPPACSRRWRRRHPPPWPVASTAAAACRDGSNEAATHHRAAGAAGAGDIRSSLRSTAPSLCTRFPIISSSCVSKVPIGCNPSCWPPPRPSTTRASPRPRMQCPTRGGRTRCTAHYFWHCCTHVPALQALQVLGTPRVCPMPSH
jgi:hypothetical protein